MAIKFRYLLKRCEITEEFTKLGFRNFVMEGMPDVINIACQTAKEYAWSYFNIKGQRYNSIALLGQVGSGKTHLLSAVSNNLLSKGEDVLYFPFIEGFDDLKSNNMAKIDYKLEKLKKVDVLFIDDLFKDKNPTNFEIRQTFSLINYRYLNHKPVLISSELTIDDLCRIDEALGSRIYEMCHDFIVHIEGEPKELNYRLRDLFNI